MTSASELRNCIIDQLSKLNVPYDESMLEEIPSKWEKHGDCILLQAKSFESKLWPAHPQIFEAVAMIMKVSKIARKSGPIQNDGFRRPKVHLLYGQDPWVRKKENGINYTWNITKCMFSSGNITEKQRIASWSCQGQTIVDLYAGIGYFTLTYLVHAKAEMVYACEWNPDAVEALEKNLALNKARDRCVVLNGDNLSTCPKNVADRVNLGLIPSSESSWLVACGALKGETGGYLHVHGNVETIHTKGGTDNEQDVLHSGIDSSGNDKTDLVNGGSMNGHKNYPNSWNSWANTVRLEIKKHFKLLYPSNCWEVLISEVVKIKSYAPHIDHLVLDLHCFPTTQTNCQ